MTREEYFELLPNEQRHFLECAVCGEMFDMRNSTKFYPTKPATGRARIIRNGGSKRIR